MATAPLILAPTLGGEYQEALGNRLATGLGNLVPIIYLSAVGGQYLAASDDGVIKQLENGFDPLLPVGFNSPAREIVQTFKEIEFAPKKFFEFMFENSVTAASIAEVIGGDVRDRHNAALSSLATDRIEWMTSKLYQDAANYGSTVPIDLADGPDALIEAIENAVAAVRPTNNRSEDYVINLVLGTKIISRLRREMAPLASKDTVYLSGNQLEEMLSDQLSANIKIFTSASVYIANATTTGAVPSRAQMWDPMLMAVTAVAPSFVGLPSFAHMPAYDVGELRGKNDGNPQYLAARVPDEFARIAEMYAQDWSNPRGARTYCESFFDVVSTDKNRGVLFTVTDSGA